ncbi:MAG: DUF4118 domain-containing protein, partial [Actinomycetota bacterium]|nr:DUF4118 domain-containing protein [Actinomycetota bacterium]
MSTRIWKAATWTLVPPLAVTGLAMLPGQIPSSVAAVLFVVAVVVAALGAGRIAGLIAALVAFLVLNYVFTPPVGTFSVAKGEDVVALGVFLVMALLVGALVSRIREQRGKAESREREARLLHQVSGRLLGGDDPGAVLGDIAERLLDLAGIEGCRITIEGSGSVESGISSGGEGIELPLLIRDRRVGEVRIWPAAGRRTTEQDRQLIRAIGAQIALALERRRSAEDARAAQADAERSRLQASLLQSVTHDLRTPLASITASVTSLLDAESVFTDEERRDLLQTIREEAERLDRLVGDLLDVSRLRAGALVGERHPISVEELIEGVLSRSQNVLRAHRVNLVIRDDLPDLPVDVLKLQQALANILENAAKFSPPGTEVSISAARWEDTVQIRVADQGVPIDPDLRTRIFEPFVRGDGGSGTGLG